MTLIAPKEAGQSAEGDTAVALRNDCVISPAVANALNSIAKQVRDLLTGYEDRSATSSKSFRAEVRENFSELKQLAKHHADACERMEKRISALEAARAPPRIGRLPRPPIAQGNDTSMPSWKHGKPSTDSAESLAMLEIPHAAQGVPHATVSLGKPPATTMKLFASKKRLSNGGQKVTPGLRLGGATKIPPTSPNINEALLSARRKSTDASDHDVSMSSPSVVTEGENVVSPDERLEGSNPKPPVPSSNQGQGGDQVIHEMEFHGSFGPVFDGETDSVHTPVDMSGTVDVALEPVTSDAPDEDEDEDEDDSKELNQEEPIQSATPSHLRRDSSTRNQTHTSEPDVPDGNGADMDVIVISDDDSDALRSAAVRSSEDRNPPNVKDEQQAAEGETMPSVGNNLQGPPVNQGSEAQGFRETDVYVISDNDFDNEVFSTPDPGRTDVKDEFESRVVQGQSCGDVPFPQLQGCGKFPPPQPQSGGDGFVPHPECGSSAPVPPRSQSDGEVPGEIQSEERCALRSTVRHSAKRKRVSVPFTNSMSRRDKYRRQVVYEEESDESSEEEESDSGEDEEQSDDEDIEQNIYSPDSVSQPDTAHNSGSNVAIRPLKIPRLEVPQTAADIEKQIEQADAICKRFWFKGNNGNPTHALKLYLSAAEAGSVPGMVRAANMYFNGAKSLGEGTTKVRKNGKLALFWVSSALREQPDFSEALNLRGDMWMYSNGKRGKTYKKALDCYTKSADLGNVGGLFRKGRLYHNQMVSATTDARRKKCCENAVTALVCAVQNGNGPAASLLGSLYENECQDEVIKEVLNELEGRDDYDAPQKAMELYWASMDLGCAQGMNDAAACYEVAYGQLIGNFELARCLYKSAFEAGYVGAAANLALLYELGGKGAYMINIDGDLALEWYQIGHVMECPVATYYLGCVYDTGSIAAPNPELAERLFVSAINYAEDSGNAVDIIPRAQHDLFAMYATKILLNSEDAEAARNKLAGRFGKAKGKAKLAKLMRDLAAVISASIDAGASGISNHPARDSARDMLGQRNYESVMRRAKLILNGIRSRRIQDLDVQEDVGHLAYIVGQQGVEKLGLLDG